MRIAVTRRGWAAWLPSHVPPYLQPNHNYARPPSPPIFTRADGHCGPIRKLLWVRGDEQLVSASEDGKVKVWQVGGAGVGGKLVRVLHGHAGAVNDVNPR